GEALEAGGELRLLVMRDDEDGERGPGQGHAAAPPWRRHSSRAAASAASTESESISVSVVRWSKPGPMSRSGGIAVRATAVRSPQGAYCATWDGPKRPRVGAP